MKKIFLIIILFLSLSVFSNVDKDNFLFAVKIDNEFKKYLDLLEKPALVILALKNTGTQQFEKIDPKVMNLQNVSFILSGNLNRYIEIPINLKFINRKNSIFEYQISSDTKFLPINTKMSVDLSKIDEEVMYISLTDLPNNLLTSSLLQKIDEKIKFLINDDTQKQLIEYIEKIYKNIKAEEKIFIDYINLERSNSFDQENIRPQKFLIINFIVLLLNIFIFSAVVRLFFKK